MNVVRLIGFATALAGGICLTSCSPMQKKKEALKKEYIETGVSAEKFIKMNDSIENLCKHSYIESNEGERVFAWKEELDKIKLQKAIDSTRAAVIDSFERAAVVAKKVK